MVKQPTLAVRSAPLRENAEMGMYERLAARWAVVVAESALRRILS